MSEQQYSAGPGELKRCTKLDFAVARERSFVRQTQQHHHQTRDCGSRRRGTMPSNRGKPTMEIYRPPSELQCDVRTDVIQNGMTPINPRLNVHAKEFTMKHGEINTSRSSVNLPATLVNNNNNTHSYRDGHRASHYLQTSKSSGNILHSIQQSKSSGNFLHTLDHSKSSGNILHTLQQSNSSGNVLQGPRVHFQLDTAMENDRHAVEAAPPRKCVPSEFSNKSPMKSCSVSEMKCAFPDGGDSSKLLRLPSTLGLKRSKSLGAADMAAAKGFGVAKEAPDLGNFPVEVQTSIHKAVEDPNKVSARSLMELVRYLMDRVVGSVSYALPAAKLCITIIEKEKKETFLESLINTCQQWYQERERMLKGPNAGSSNLRYCAFMQFLNEMYCELKRRQLQLKTQCEGVPPGLVLLTLLCKCCQDCLKPPNTQAETDSLFFVLTSIGRDLEQELPSKLQQLLCSIRDAFLSSVASPTVRKTLLQLIELHAAKWQLPASSVMYYTTNL